MHSMIPLGPFLLGSPLGRGGMGQVWSGLHQEHGVPVAVKVLTREGTREPAFLAAFRNEVRATAGLDHPGIVRIYDHGRVPLEAESRSGGLLPAGRPFLVMELVGGGPLGPWCGRLAWHAVREVLLGLLDALAHAHARGVVHRDLKPGNVLYRTDAVGVKLTDFGLAHAVDREQAARGEDAVTGTPAYMAPEQCLGHERDTGPWTDLYAFGCVAWCLVTGAPPFGRPAPADAMAAHLYRPVPPLEPTVAVPDGLEDWLGRLLEKDPANRHGRAADAAWALLQLGDARPPTDTRRPPPPAPDPPSREDSVTIPIPVVPRGLNVTDPNIPVLTLPPRLAPRRRPRPEQPPFPAQGRGASPGDPPAQLAGVGLGLFGLRTLQIVDRETERAALWCALGEVHATRSPRMIELRGAAGVGKGRLAEWICEQAHAAGAATVLRATHSARAGPSDGIVPMLLRHLRCLGLVRHEVVDRVRAWLEDHGGDDAAEAAALAELLAPAPTGDRGWPGAPDLPVWRFLTANERHAVARRALDRIAAERPVVLWIDAVQWGADALEFALGLWTNTPAPPVLVVVTVTTDELEAQAEEDEVLERLVAVAGAKRVDVAPLQPADARELVRHRLGLAPGLAARVEAGMGGNPLYAVQLVGEWVHRGDLEPGGDGFRLRPGVDVAPPSALASLWEQRAATLLAARGADDATALEIAAALGQEIVTAEWLVACGCAGVQPAVDLVDALLEARLARSGEDGPEVRWFFAHAMLRQVLERRAAAGGRAPTWHRACASMLAFREGRQAPERHAHHLLAAGAPDEALAPFLTAGRARIDAGDYLEADRLLSRREQAMEDMGLPQADARWGEGWITAGWLAFQRGLYDLALGWHARAEVSAVQHGWHGVRARAVLEQASLRRGRGDVELAARLLRTLEPDLRTLGDAELSARWLLHMGQADSDLGRLEQAAARFRESHRQFLALGREREAGACCDALFNLHKQLGDFDAAEAAVHEALRRFETCGHRAGVADSLTNLGELARLRGDLEGAETFYREALARARAIGAVNAAFPLVNLGLLLQEWGRWSESRPLLEEGLRSFVAHRRLAYVAALHVCLLPSVAALGDWAAWDLHLAEARGLLARTRFVDLDIGRAATTAARMAADAGEPGRAREAALVAHAQWTALGRASEAGAIEAVLATLPT